MSARIIRIVGPSYCGSTALGYAMNTGDGFFFGSEMYRYLVSWREANSGGRFANCDFCGADCLYWTRSLKNDLEERRVDRLDVVHDTLIRNHSEIEFLVDGSKIVPTPDDRAPFALVVPTKHPLRLLASHVYNRRERLGVAEDDLVRFGEQLELNRDVHRSSLASGLKRFAGQYRRTFDACVGAHRFRTDEAHLDGFAEFRRLEHMLELPAHSFDPANFGVKPSHTLGGNRAPIWLAKNRSGQDTPQNARTEYYDSTESVGDWKLDDKFRIVFGPRTLETILALPEYGQLCELLGYDSAPPDNGL